MTKDLDEGVATAIEVLSGGLGYLTPVTFEQLTLNPGGAGDSLNLSDGQVRATRGST